MSETITHGPTFAGKVWIHVNTLKGSKPTWMVQYRDYAGRLNKYPADEVLIDGPLKTVRSDNDDHPRAYLVGHGATVDVVVGVVTVKSRMANGR